MKKLILVVAVVALVASPALAVDWNFYGSSRVGTWYMSRDYNNSNFPANGGFDGNTGANPAGTTEDDTVDWEFQPNSRIGANVKAESIKAQFEFGVNTSTVTERRMWAEWDFGAASLEVGDDYGALRQFVSGQAGGNNTGGALDAGLLGNGTLLSTSHPLIGLRFGGFKVDLIQNQGNGLRNITTGNINKYFPQLQVGYAMSFDTWNLALNGAVQTYEIEDAGTTNDTVDVTSWLLAGQAGVNFGPAYLKGAVSYGVNTQEFGLTLSTQSAAYDGGNNVDDMTSFTGALIAGFKFTDMVTFEAGVGYTLDDSDVNGEDDADTIAVYGQAVLSLAPGVWLIPEVGYYNFGNDYSPGQTGNDAGDMIYAGAKWQIDF
jgi:hypothetical protein